jgi:cbb3-type cytochrome oxidase cytochrome c subunit
VVVPKLTDETLRKMSAMNLLFAASSVGLLVTMGWMVYDDYSRGWKTYQKKFQRLEAEKTHAQIDAAEKAIDKSTLDSLLKQRAEAEAAAGQHAKNLDEAQKKLREIETVAYRDDLGYRTTKSTFDAKKFDYEEAAHRGLPKAATIEKDMNALQKQLEDLRVKGLLHEKEKADAQAAIDAINGRIAETDKKIGDLEAGVDRLKKKLDTVEPTGLMKVAIDVLNAPLLDFVAPSLKIQQVVLDRVPLDINFARVPRADRCQTCHLSADRAGFEDAAEPFRTHANLNFFLGGSSPHPVDRFGCTACHRGRDRAVDFLYAVHQPNSEEQTKAWEKEYGWKHDHYWEQPMLALRRTEAACLKCHQGVVSIPEAPRLNRALEIVNRYGCYGCHKMRGFENRPKVAPTLMHPTSKLTTEWMARWIKNPKAFRPSTRMPRLFGLENNQADGDADREDAEITGIVAYLAEKAEKRSYPPLPGRGDAERGRKLVKSIGCMGCHAIERDDVPAETLQARNDGHAADPIAWERRFGPDLSRIGSKAKPEWIYQWILNPRQYNPDTRMPNLRLTSQEALDITAFLTTLKDDTPSERRVAPVGPRPQARDAALLAYLSQRMPPQEAQAKLAAMTEHDRDVLLGERTISRYGCFGCHLIPGFEKTPPIGTDLSEEGSKPADLLLFGFVQIEHTSPAWFYQKMKEPRSFDQGHVAEFYDRLRMPQFGFTDEMADAVTLLLQGLTKEKMPLESMRRLSARDEAVEAGRRLVRDYNCQGCHILEGKGGAIRESIAKNLQAKGLSEEEAMTTAPSFSPPILEGEGDKVQPDWLFAFLKGPTPIRPWLEVRMPTFQFTDTEADALVHHFAAREQRLFPFQTLPREPPKGPDLQAALKMFGPDYFNCWNCHQQGARKPPGPPEGWAPDLTLASRRLNADWIARWLSNPQKLMPGTKMPTFYDPDDPKGSAPPDVLGGDPERQIRALSEYVFTLGLRHGGTSTGASP